MTHGVGLIGCFNSVASAREMMPPGCELRGLCDINPSLLQACRQEDPNLLITDQFEELAACDAIDSVVTFTPNTTHYAIALTFLKAGKNLFLEKPMALTLEAGREILAMEAASSGHLQIDLEMRALGMGPTIKQIIDSGELGRIVQFDHDHYRGGWLRNSPSGDYRTRRETSGLFKMEGIHHLDLARYLLGDIEAVQCFSAPNVLPQYEFPDNVTAILYFENGAIGRYTTSHTRCAYSVGKDLSLSRRTGHMKFWSIVGEKGSLWVDAWTQQINVFHFEADPPNTKSLKPEFHRRLDFSDSPKPLDWFHNIHGNRQMFLSRMAAGLSPIQSASDAFESECVAHVADEAALTPGIKRYIHESSD